MGASCSTSPPATSSTVPDVQVGSDTTFAEIVRGAASGWISLVPMKFRSASTISMPLVLLTSAEPTVVPTIRFSVDPSSIRTPAWIPANTLESLSVLKAAPSVKVTP